MKHGAGGTGDSSSTLTYPAAGAARPHALQAVSGNAVTSGAFGYDASGNTTSSPDNTLTYDADGRVASVTTNGPGGTGDTGSPASAGTAGTHGDTGVPAGTTQSDRYAADGSLLVQSDPVTGTTLFLGDTEVHRAVDGTVTATRTYRIDGIPVDERTTAGGSNQVFALDTDIDGTADLEVGASDKEHHPPLVRPVRERTRFLSVDPAGPGTDPQQRDGYANGDDSVTNPWSPSQSGARTAMCTR